MCASRFPKANATVREVSEKFLKFSKEKGLLRPFPFYGQDVTGCLLVQNSTAMEHLSTEERFTIQHMNQQGKSSTRIGNVLSRATTSITRELRRNAQQDDSYSAVFA